MERHFFELNGMDAALEKAAGGDDSEVLRAAYLQSLKRTEGTVKFAVESAGPAIGAERRRSIRYRCDGSVEFRAEGSDVRTWGTLSDVSMHGCYVEMTATSPVGTVVELTLDAAGVRVLATGEVKVSYPFLGMGIALRLTDEERPRLREMLQRLSARTGTQDAPEEAPVHTAGMPFALPSFAEAGELIKTLARFFESHASLSRDEFHHMIEEQRPQSR